MTTTDLPRTDGIEVDLEQVYRDGEQLFYATVTGARWSGVPPQPTGSNEQDERLAAVLQQACNRAAFVPPGSDGAERQLVVSAIGGGVEAANKVTVEGVLRSKHDADQPAA
jgi:hypothetical protein